jgi:7,8-dihydropterin-6-yl-methyl-4-(beta-D-ribofuranosyl)aminobenzene 5'-phosphate synthase
VITGHCTGDEAFTILKEELGEIIEQMYTGMEIEL